MTARFPFFLLSLLLCTSCTALNPSGAGSHAADEAGIVTDEAGIVTAVEGGVGPSPSGGETDSGVMEACNVEGERRCAVRAGQRERCTAGFWIASEPCASGEVCANQPIPATCQAVAAICRGSVDQAVCDGQGIMYQCNAQGVATSQETCSSPQTCQMGVVSRKCLMCIPGSHKCTGTSLERCNSEGTAYALLKTCATAALCNTSVGDCTQMACLPNGHTCQGDMLRRCNATQTAYEDVKMCKPGLCDERNGQCDECSPSATSCEMNTATSCSADGQMLARMTCPAATPRCVGIGRCVQCSSDMDCADPGVCKTRHCNLATGMCAPQNQVARTACAGGLCDGSGNCGGCLQNPDCPDPGPCKTRFCNASRVCAPTNMASGTGCGSGGGGYCDGAGTCADCVNDTHCSAPLCQAARCTAGRCVISSLSAGTRDSRCPTGRVCSGSANTCVQCTATSQCPSGQICESNSCAVSCGNRQVDTAAGEQCEPGVGSHDSYSCNRETCKLTGLRGTTIGKDCGSLTCSSGEVCVLAEQGAPFGFPMCLKSCGFGVCSMPPGWTGGPCFGTPSGCYVHCGSSGECPIGSTCWNQGGAVGICR